MKDVIVIGGGLIGCAVAAEIAKRGLRVAVLERGQPGNEASWASAGMLAPQTEAERADEFFEFCYRGLKLYRDYVDELRNLTGLDACLRSEGALQIAFDEAEAKRLDQVYRWQIEAGLPIEKLNAAELARMEAALSNEVSAGYYFPAEMQVDNRRLCEAVVAAAYRRGVEFISCAATEIVIERRAGRRRATGVRTNQHLHSAATIINAAGCWAGLLTAEGVELPTLIPIHGQMVALRTRPDQFCRTLHFGHNYLVPRLDGRVIIGSTAEQIGFEKRVTAEALKTLLARAIQVVPALATAEMVEFWSGLRPATIDRKPLLGQHPEVSGLVYASGHYRNGILLAPITAQLIADLVVDAKEDESLKPYNPARNMASGAGA